MTNDPRNYAANTVAAKLYNLVGSPTEMVLGMALFEALSKFYEHWSCRVYSNAEAAILKRDQLPSGCCVLGLVPQLTIPDVGRVDFAILMPALSVTAPLVVV